MADGFFDVGIWRSRHSLRVLGVSDWLTGNGAPIQRWGWHGGNNQLWQVVMPSHTTQRPPW